MFLNTAAGALGGRELYNILKQAHIALLGYPRWERGAYLLWLCGPLLLLIERTPADIWLSLIVIIFLIRSIVNRNWSWASLPWFQAASMFLGVCLLSASLSAVPFYAASEAMAWFRFPLFAAATACWLGKDSRLLKMMLVMTGLGMLAMTGILFAELLIEGQKHSRLTWPYGDLVPGNYLTKVGLPAFVIMIALAVGAKPKMALLMIILSLSTLSMSIMAGERVNFIIRVCAGFLAALVWRPVKCRLIALLLLKAFAIASLFIFFGDTAVRFTTDVIYNLPIGPKSDYYRVFGAGYLVFLESPLIGIGPAAYRELCPELLFGYEYFRCDNHPHNYYLQLLTETGLAGLVTGSMMILLIIKNVAEKSFSRRDNVVVATAFIIPLGLFFPFQSTADFFGQWNNIFMWSAVALSMAMAESDIE